MSIYFVDFTQFITMWSAFLIRACGTCELKALVTGENVLGCCGDEHLKRCLNDLEVPNEQRGNACQPLAHLRRMGTPQNKRVSMSSQVHFGLKMSWNFWQSHGTKMYKSYPRLCEPYCTKWSSSSNDLVSKSILAKIIWPRKLHEIWIQAVFPFDSRVGSGTSDTKHIARKSNQIVMWTHQLERSGKFAYLRSKPCLKCQQE